LENPKEEKSKHLGDLEIDRRVILQTLKLLPVCGEWIYLVKERYQWRGIMKTVMNDRLL
jgi:hypothetical protein